MCYLEHEKCYREGIVQRDVSTNNIIISNGEGHLIDFDYAKITGRFKLVANGVPERIKEFWYQGLLSKFDEAVISQAEEMMGNANQAFLYLHTLMVVQPTSKLPSGQQLRLSMKDLGWCKEVNLILLMGSSLMFPLVI